MKNNKLNLERILRIIDCGKTKPLPAIQDYPSFRIPDIQTGVENHHSKQCRFKYACTLWTEGFNTITHTVWFK